MTTKKIVPRLPSGFNELLPEKQAIFEFYKREIAKTYESLGYSPIETSSLELTDVLLAKGGGETEKQVYSFTKGKNNLTLRYDLTVPLARYVAQNYNSITFPFKRYQMQKVWRAEKAQKGRSREFYQCDVDILGNTGIVADADSVFAVYSALKKIQTPKFTININNRKLIIGLLDYFKVKIQSIEVLKIIDKLSKIPSDVALQELTARLNNSELASKILDIFSTKGSLETVLNIVTKYSLQSSVGFLELKALYDLLINLGIPKENLCINLSVVRGLDYYTSSVFETFLDQSEKFGSIASGGRYDELASYYTTQSVPGVGMSIGLTRLFDILTELNCLPTFSKNKVQVLICYLSEDAISYSTSVLLKLREQNILSSIYLGSNLSLNKQLSYASKLKFPFALILGENEINNNTVTMKNMVTGEQKTLSLEQALLLFKN